MSLSDIELVKLEEQRTTASDAVDENQDRPSAPSPLPSSPALSSPHIAPSLAPQPQAATLPPPAASEHHAEQQQQHRPPANTLQAAPAALNATTQEAEDSYLHPADKLWSLYLKDADTEDKHLVESWKGDTDGILIFTGLFAATVATFVTQTYQLLISPSDDPSAAILLQVSQQLAGSSNGTSVPAYTAPPFRSPFQPPLYAVWVNTLWFLSLFLSLTGALMATLMQQWTRRYLRGIQYRSAPHIRGPMQVMLRLGVKKYRMKQAVAFITSILHASVFIFFAGLVVFAFNLHSTVASIITPCVSVLVAAYISLSILPMFSTVAPYDTVLTPALQTFYHLGRFLSALALRRTREARAPLGHLNQDEDPVHALNSDLRETVHDAREHHSRSREQELMCIAGKDGHLATPHATYALDRILMNADEHHEIENFLGSVAVLLSNRRSSYASLINSLTLEILFKQHLFGDKVRSLVHSCADFNRNGISSSARIKRLRTVLAFVRHEDVRKVAHLSARMVARNLDLRSILFWLTRDRNPSISFLSRLIMICTCMEANVDGEIQRYDFGDLYASAVAYGYYGEGTDAVAWPLFCLVELACVILKFTTFNSADDPVATYRHLWQPMLEDVQKHTFDYLRKTQRESEDLIVEPIPRALLSEAGLGDLVHPFYVPPARRLPTSADQLKIKHAFSTYPDLVNALSSVARRASLIPLYGPSPQPNPGPRGSLAQPDDNSAAASFPLRISHTGAGCVLFGPLTWGDPPRYEYYRLMDAWNKPFADSLHYYDVFRDHERGEGYARIFFRRKADARKFADTWTATPLPAYRVVTAEFLDDGEGSTGENSGLDEIDEDEDEAQGGGETDGSVRDRNWVKSCWGSILTKGAASRKDQRSSLPD